MKLVYVPDPKTDFEIRFSWICQVILFSLSCVRQFENEEGAWPVLNKTLIVFCRLEEKNFHGLNWSSNDPSEP